MDAIPPVESDPYEPPRSSPAPPARTPLSLLIAACGALAVLLACLIGFVATCVPLGIMSLGVHGTGGTGPLAGNGPVWGGAVGGALAGLATLATLRAFFRRRRPAGPPPGEGRPDDPAA